MSILTDGVEILLVEDNPTDAELAIVALKERNLANKLVWVKDGAEALDFLFATGVYAKRNIEKPPKVVLLDLRLPKVDGLEVLRHIREDERFCNVPVVVLTTSSEDCDVHTAYQLYANSYIVKPVDFDKFVQVADRINVYWCAVNTPPR